MPQAAGQVKILIFLVKIKFSPYMPIIFLMQGKCLFSDISRPGGKRNAHIAGHMFYVGLYRGNMKNQNI